MGLKELYKKKDIKNYEDIIKHLETLEKEKWILNKLKKEILKLKRSEVKPQDTYRRAKIARHFTENSQLLIYFLHKYNNKNKSDSLIFRLMKIKDAGELILRENPIIQTSPPIDVLKWENMPIRYAINFLGFQELRKGFGLHTNPLNEMGLSATIAFMPTNYSQLFHYHPLPEFSFNLDAEIIGKYMHNKSEKTFKIKKEEMAYFKSNTIHKLENPSRLVNRNISIKSRQAILKWKPYYQDKKIREGYGEVTKNYKIKRYTNYIAKNYKFKNHYNYNINILKIIGGRQINLLSKTPQFLFVSSGELKITTNNRVLRCGRNDVIVVDSDTKFTIKSITGSNIYCVNPQ